MTTENKSVPTVMSDKSVQSDPSVMSVSLEAQP